MRRHDDKSPMDRLPPHNLSAEQGVISSILLDAQACMPTCIDKLIPDSFYDGRNRKLFSLLLEMFDDQQPINFSTIATKPEVDLEYLSSIAEASPSAANLDYFVEIVREEYWKRRLLQVSTETAAQVYECGDGVETLLDHAEKALLSIRQSRTTKTERPIKELVHAAINRIEELHQNQGRVQGIPTGFHDFDKMTGGLQNGEMVVIAARPSMGKTSLAMNIAEHAAIDQRIPVGVFSLEMTDESLVMRMVCSRARVDMQRLRDGFLAERDFPKITNVAGKIANAALFIDDSSGLSILQLRAKARRMHQQHGIKLLVIDYLQLLHSTNRRADNRQQEVADISNGIKALAKELNVPVIVLAQLNRELEKDKNRKPRLADLRESGSIEQDADLVGLLYDANRADDDEAVTNPESKAVNLLIAKQRNGPTGDVHLTFLRSITRFESAAKVDYQDAPRSPHND